MADDFWERYRHPLWQEKKARIIERDGWCCRRCNEDCRQTGKTAHVHHGYYRRDADPWDYPDDTLFTVCEDCHAIIGDAKHDVHLEVARFGVANLECLIGLIRSLRELRDFDPSMGRYQDFVDAVIGRVECAVEFPVWSAFEDPEPDSLDMCIALGMGVSA